MISASCVMHGHEIPTEVFRSLGTGGGGTATRLLLAGQRSKQMLVIRAVAEDAALAAHPQAQPTARGYALLARLERLAPRAVQDVLGHPAVGAWALDCVLGLRADGAHARPERLASVAAAAAIRGNVSCEVEIYKPAADDVLELPSLGRLRHRCLAGAGSVVIRGHPAVAELAGARTSIRLPRRLTADAPSWLAVRPVSAAAGRARIRLLFDDLDPYRFPRSAGLREHVPGAELAVWRRLMTGAWRMLANDHPETAADVATVLTAIAPLQSTGAGQMSASSRYAFGCIALSLPGDRLSLALALAHEVQHAKLSALMDLFPLIANPSRSRERFYAPWRDDPRPIVSLLHGAYAHVGVVGFWRRRCHVASDPAEVFHAQAEFARWRDACLQVADFLSGRPELTRHGLTFVAGMLQRLHEWHADFVPRAARRYARQAAADHYRRWLCRHRQGATV